MATTVPSIISPSSSSSASAEFNVAKGHVSAYAYAEGDEFWLWGRADDTTTAEDKERVVSCYDPLLEVWETHECSGDIPPPECRCYGTSATLDGSIYLYGGGSLAKLEPGTLYQVDSKSWELNICFTTASRAPPAQQLCKMVAFEDKELKKKLVLFGASGSPTTAEESSSLVWSNKVHVFDLDEKELSSPKFGGDAPPLLAGFSLTMINDFCALLFGGVLIAESKGFAPEAIFSKYKKSDQLYLIDLENRYNWKKLACTGDAGKRAYHAAVSLSKEDSARLLISGGIGEDGQTLQDMMLLENNNAWKWTKLKPECERFGHTMAAFTFSPSLTEVVVFGGQKESEGGEIRTRSFVHFNEDFQAEQAEEEVARLKKKMGEMRSTKQWKQWELSVMCAHSKEEPSLFLKWLHYFDLDPDCYGCI